MSSALTGPSAPSRPSALTVAGSDSSGGAGVVADAKTFAAHRVWALVAITAVTAQGRGVRRFDAVDPDLVRAQIETVVDHVGVDAAKTGMLATAAIVHAVADSLPDVPLVVDPVIRATSGAELLDAAGVEAIARHLIPRAWLVTPNLAEAAVLTGRAVDDRREMEAAARALVDTGCRAALITGGHLPGDVVADCLVVGAGAAQWLEAPRLTGGGLHGTGCVLSAAVAARLALGHGLETACTGAVAFVRAAIAAGGPAGVSPG